MLHTLGNEVLRLNSTSFGIPYHVDSAYRNVYIAAFLDLCKITSSELIETLQHLDWHFITTHSSTIEKPRIRQCSLILY